MKDELLVKNDYTLVNILEHRMKGKTLQEIGNIYNVSLQAIHKKLKGIFAILDKEEHDGYEQNKVKIFSAIERELLQSALQPNKLKKMSSRDAVVAFGIIHDKNRLEQGLSTENVAIQGVSAELAEKATNAADHLDKLKAQLTVNNTDGVDNKCKDDV